MMTSLEEIASLSIAFLSAIDKMEEIEEEFKVAKEKVRRLREESLPSAMQELGLVKFELKSGETVSIKQDVFASIPESNREQAFGWLEDNGFGGLIKTEVSVAFGRGELDRAKILIKELNDSHKYTANLERGVHAQTLKAFLKEQMSIGSDIPLDLFGAIAVFTAKVTQPTKTNLKGF